MSLIKLIEKFNRKKRILFTTPSHNQGEFINPKSLKLLGKKVFKSDYSEIEDFDNLASPEGVILESQQKAAEIYQSKFSFYLPNGSTSGIIAIMLALLSQNDKVLIARNCHKSVYNGLVLTGACPIWITPKFNEEWGIFKPINANDVEKILSQHQDIKAFILTNPSYEGIISDISKIADVCKQYNVALIVDEAHGALWNFDKTIGTPAIYLKADATVQSLHKTAGALNPSAILHIAKDSAIDLEKVQSSLNLINTTSPSYPILTNIEATINFLHSKKGKNEISKLINNISEFKMSLSNYENIHIYYQNNDITKILIKIDGLSGTNLSNILFDKYKIEDELNNEKSVLFLTGIGTTKKKLNILKKALIKISKKQLKKGSETEQEMADDSTIICEPKVALTPQKVHSLGYKTIKTEESVGHICKEIIINYPPGMPILAPGEIIQDEHLSIIKTHKTIKVLAN